MAEGQGLVQCYNKACGKKFKEEENDDSACTYHPGNPVFHDALKGWSCCRKRTTDFSEFLSIPGCTVGQHNPVKPPEPEPQVSKPLEVGEEIIVKASPTPKRIMEVERPPDDLPYKPLRVSVSGSLRSLLQRLKLKEEEETQKSTEKEGESGGDQDEIAVGTHCKNKGCQAVYTGTDTDFQPCEFHSGFPIFHEGYKFWTCCQRRTSDFNEFLRQEGCQSGDHLWTEVEEKEVICKHDWHQTGNFIIVSVFTKACVPDQCLFEANPTNLQATVTFDNGQRSSRLHIRLKGVIVPEQSSVELLGTKAEIKMRKASPASWSSLYVIEPKPTPPVKQEEEDLLW